MSEDVKREDVAKALEWIAGRALNAADDHAFRVVADRLATLEREGNTMRAALQAAVDHCRRCGGKGTYQTACTLCGDSTFDHECDDETRECPDCKPIRAALTPAAPTGGAAIHFAENISSAGVVTPLCRSAVLTDEERAAMTLAKVTCPSCLAVVQDGPRDATGGAARYEPA